MILNNLKNRFPSFWILQIASWTAYFFMIYITFLPVLPPDGSKFRLLHHKLVRAIIGFLLSSALRLIYKRFAHSRSFRFTALLAMSASVLFGCLWPVMAKAYAWLVDSVSFQFELARYPKDALDYSSTLLAWSAFYFGIKYWQTSQAEEERALKANALAHQAQLEMLRYQLNPHFLFNALNSIRASIDEDSKRAKRMITELSEFLRYSLLNGNSSDISLREEIEAIRNYLAIEKIRFEERLDIKFDIDPVAEEYQLPAFLIHPLVENAVKHGMSGPLPLKIQLTARARNGTLYVEVANTGRWLENSPRAEDCNGIGIGLKNVRQRLSQLFPDRSSFSIREDNGWIHAIIEINRP